VFKQENVNESGFTKITFWVKELGRKEYIKEVKPIVYQ